MNSSYILQETNLQGSLFYFLIIALTLNNSLEGSSCAWGYNVLTCCLTHCSVAQRKDWRHVLETIPWSNAGGGMTQEGYRMHVFSGEENALRHKHLLHVHECPSCWHKATSLKCSLSLGGASISHRTKLLLALWTPAMIKQRYLNLLKWENGWRSWKALADIVTEPLQQNLVSLKYFSSLKLFFSYSL